MSIFTWNGTLWYALVSMQPDQILSCLDMQSINVGCTVKQIRRFYSKIPGNQLPVHMPLFLWAACRTFLEIKKW